MRLLWFVVLGGLCAALVSSEAAAQRFGGKFRGAAGAGNAPPQKRFEFPSAPQEPEQWVGMKIMPRTPTAAFGLQDQPTGHASDVAPWPQTVKKVSGNWLWIEAPGAQGWIQIQDVAPLADAIVYFNEQLARRQTPWGLYMRGSALRDQERFDETYKDFKALEKLDEKEFAALTKQANAQSDKRDYRGLIATTTRMARLFPSNVTIYTARGYAYLALNDSERAKADFDHAVELAASTETYAARAAFYQQQGEITRAIEDLDKAIYHWPLIRLYEERAKCLILQKEYVRAVDDLNIAIAHNSPKVENHLLRGRAELASGQLYEANVDFAAAIRLAPKAATYHQIAECRYDCGQLAQAIDDSSIAIRLDPKLAAAYAVRGRALADLKREDEALADFSSALRVNRSRDAEILLSRAQLYWRRAEVDQCLSDVRDAIRLGLRTSAGLLLQAAAQTAQGDHDSAIATLDGAIQRAPWLGEAYELRSVAYWIAGNDEQALADCAEARRFAKDARRTQFSTKEPVDQLLACPSDLRRATFLSDVGLRSLAIELANQAIKRLPSQIDGYRIRGLTYFASFDFAAAQKDFEVVLAQNSDDEEIQARHNYCRFCLDNPEDVITEMNRQLGLRGPSFSAFFVRAWAWGKSHQVEHAIEDATDALTFADEADLNLVAECYMLRSSAQAHLGQTTFAKEDRQRAEALCPGINRRWDEQKNRRAREQIAQNSAAASLPVLTDGGGKDHGEPQPKAWEQEFSLDSALPGWGRRASKGP